MCECVNNLHIGFTNINGVIVTKIKNPKDTSDVFVGYMGEQGRSPTWVATFSIYIQREAAKASTSLQSGSHERTSKILYLSLLQISSRLYSKILDYKYKHIFSRPSTIH